MNKDPIEERLKALEDSIRQDQDLLKSYEDKERYESDPRGLASAAWSSNASASHLHSTSRSMTN
ncbi:MAG: hypothetical protein C5S48_02625 [Candidatus Methanogaster sp.]|nr:MAG: hypothetical protein C5S48_02625 [ANME-2 cluster archaeon]